jgi:hypothetical protein
MIAKPEVALEPDNGYSLHATETVKRGFGLFKKKRPA